MILYLFMGGVHDIGQTRNVAERADIRSEFRGNICPPRPALYGNTL